MFKKPFYALRVIILAILIFPLGGVVSFAQGIPAPEKILGIKPGADYHLANYRQAIEYFKALEEASPMIKLFEMGKTEMEKPMIYAVITSADNMKKLDHFKEISKKMALAKGLSNEEARRLAAKGRAVVYIDGGLHASECAPAQHNIQLAYDLLASEDPDIRFIRNNTILLLVFANPDGMDMLAEWYHQNVGTPYEISLMPWVYNKYVGHDNNQDFIMLNMNETWNITRLVNQEWHPQILYNHHQRGPFPARIWIPPYAEPTTPNVHPLLIRWQNLIGCAMGVAFDREAKEGVISRTSYDTWYPGFLGFISHNIITILTETALYHYATPHFYTLNNYPEIYKDFTISAFYPNPWKGGWWRLKDAVDYCLSASKAVLHVAAKYHSELLYDRYLMGKGVISRFQKESPYAWIIQQAQWDVPTAALLLKKMRMQGIEVYKAEEPFVSDGISYPGGTWVIPMNQAFGLFVKKGGTLVALNYASLFAIDKLGLPLRNVMKDVKPPMRLEIPKDKKPPKFICPGSVLRMEFDPEHPVAYGMPKEAGAKFIYSPAFTILPFFEEEKAPVVIAKYPRESLLMSGYLKGEEYLQNRVSAVEVPLGMGRVILLGFGVQNRGQTHGTFKLVFNSLYYGSAH